MYSGQATRVNACTETGLSDDGHWMAEKRKSEWRRQRWVNHFSLSEALLQLDPATLTQAQHEASQEACTLWIKLLLCFFCSSGLCCLIKKNKHSSRRRPMALSVDPFLLSSCLAERTYTGILRRQFWYHAGTQCSVHVCIHTHTPLYHSPDSHSERYRQRRLRMSQTREGIMPKVGRAGTSWDPPTLARNPHESTLRSVLRGRRGLGWGSLSESYMKLSKLTLFRQSRFKVSGGWETSPG